MPTKNKTKDNKIIIFYYILLSKITYQQTCNQISSSLEKNATKKEKVQIYRRAVKEPPHKYLL